MNSPLKVLLFVLVTGLIVGFVWGVNKVMDTDIANYQHRLHQTYVVWCKLNPNDKLTFEEWRIAYDAGLLRNRR